MGVSILKRNSIRGKRRRRDRHIAWGVSPRKGVPNMIQPRSGDRRVSLSPLRGYGYLWIGLTLGLTPQAMCLPPLRGWRTVFRAMSPPLPHCFLRHP